MKAIYKYSLPVQEKFTVDLPEDAEIIRVDDVDGLFWLWAIVETDPGHPKKTYRIECYKTGQPIDTDITELRYIGCCKLFIMQELCLYMFENVSPRIMRSTVFAG